MQFAAEREPKSRLYLHQSREFTNGNFDVKTQLPWLQYESNSLYSGFIRDVKAIRPVRHVKSGALVYRHGVREH
jgi:hypothetical protein